MKKTVVIYFLALLALSCNKHLTVNGESFEGFYDRFHTDADFQLSRVKFPLDGNYEDATGVTVWNKSNWIMHQQKITDIKEPGYKTEMIRKDDLVTDKVQLEGSGYFSERRFERINGKWYLVYYDAANL